MEFAKSIGTETNAAILDLELVTKNPITTISEFIILMKFINQMIIKNKKRQCFSCGYAGACVNTCTNGKPSKC